MDQAQPPSDEARPAVVTPRSTTSPKRRAANRLNALRSTGPRTTAGKQRVRMNAIQHGLLAQDVLLPGEDVAAYNDLAQRVRAERGAAGAEEEALVDRMIACLWRLRRVARVETGILTYEHFSLLAPRARREARTFERFATHDTMKEPSRP